MEGWINDGRGFWIPWPTYVFLAVLTSSSQNATRIRSESASSGLNRPALLKPSMSREQLLGGGKFLTPPLSKGTSQHDRTI